MIDTNQILALSDAGHTPAQIATALAIAPGPVYAVLRAHRPERPRAPRTRTSELPAKMLALHDAGVKVARIAELLRVKRAYVYRILAERTEATT